MNPKKLSVWLVVVLALLFGVAVAVSFWASRFGAVRIVDRSVLLVDLRRTYPEHLRLDLWLFGWQRQMPFYRLLYAVEAAARDEDIEALVIRGYSMLGLSKSWELARAIEDFRAAGKPVYGYFDYAGPSDVLLASVCDTVALAPAGDVAVPGFLANALFIKGTLEKIGIDVEVIQMGKYKGVEDFFARDSMSPWLRESYEKLLDDLYGRFTSDCARGFGITQDSVEGLIDLGILTPEEAVAAGIADTIMYWNDLKSHLVGDDEDRLVPVHRYARRKPPWDVAEKKVALVIAEGSIVPSDGFWSRGITSRRYARLLRKLADDDEIDAIVFRVESPGGSALASDVIYREVARAAQKKPVVVSMGALAASGGYYISMAADTIFATPYTITGSIGVAMLRVCFAGLYDKLGARSQTIKRGRFADIFVGDHRLSDDERALLVKVAGKLYEQFVSKAARSRDTSYAWLDSVAQGRIWSAEAAESVALVDTIGSLWDAIVFAERALGVPQNKHAKLVVKPGVETLWDFLREAGAEVLLPAEVPERLRLLGLVDALANRPAYLWVGGVSAGGDRQTP